MQFISVWATIFFCLGDNIQK